jgi:hypothetical protein
VNDVAGASDVWCDLRTIHPLSLSLSVPPDSLSECDSSTVTTTQSDLFGVAPRSSLVSAVCISRHVTIVFSATCSLAS